ncbi:shikimate dehydrogenase [Bifidobacterium sp. ESL0763]|uniref:shikimate dehydrogenase family protein n=1 Tax=Bifidobacterium sp. ESL0763 TaxID=2983227 RepID=UPI0023F67FFF|nr:shikimate dehydrogenase [Bifidobacterium sp. ESL0763]MDF7663847.1 shikimate dehydrogenase [Bifidobacterium sp. ESL0763]
MNSAAHQCAVLGKPISHSLSPTLHNAAYRYLRMPDWRYSRAEVGKDDLHGFLESLDNTWAGLSLTMPLKRTVIPYGTTCDTWSKRLQVANTAIFDRSDSHDGTMPTIRLYNTDVNGIVNAFDHSFGQRQHIATPDDGPRQPDGTGISKQANSGKANATNASSATDANSRKGFRAVIMGNGNTALSALAACTEMKGPGLGGLASVTVCARNPAHGEALRRLAGHYEGRFDFAIEPLPEAWRFLMDADVAINTIPGLGADPTAEALDTALRHGDGNTITGTLLDVVYDPRPTKLMKTWRAFGGATIGGEEMLLYQAIDQVLLMTGIGLRPQPQEAGNPNDASTEGSSMASIPTTGTPRSLPGLERAMRAALREAL